MRLRLAAGLLLLFAVLSACSPADRRELTRTAFRAGLDSSSPGARDLLQQGFPQEYAHLENAAIERALAGVPTEANRRQASDDFLQLLRTHAADLARAPNADLRATVSTYVAVLLAMQTTNVANCAAVARGNFVPIGAAAGTPLFRATSENNVANLRAIVHARQTPSTHRVLSETERRRLVDGYRTRGGSMAYLQGGGLSDADTCRSEILIHQVVLDQPDEMVAGFVVASLTPPEASPAPGPAAGAKRR